MKYTKEELEKLIEEKFTIGKFTFDVEKQCFLNETEICIGIVKISETRYQDDERYFYDGYEIGLEEIKEYEGNEETAKSQAIKYFNREIFLGYPIICSNIKCDVV